MNLAKRFQLLNIAVLAVFSVAGLAAADRPEFKKTDQPFVFFKAIKGAKYPGMIKADPAVNQMTVILCGATTTSGEVKSAKKARDLKNLVAIRNTMNFADSGTQIDKTYVGYREPYAAIALTKLLMLAGLYPTEGYNGTVLVDEYVQGLPMKIVLSNMEQFAALKAYLVANFEKLGVVPAAQKPLLLLEILDKNAVLSDSDKEFLNTYFEVLDPYNSETKAFFDGAQKTLFDMMDKTKDAKNVADSFGEATMRELEKAVKGFDTKKLATVLTMLVAADIGKSIKDGTGVLGSFVGSLITSPFGEFKDKKWISNEHIGRNIVITAASVAALVYVMHVLFSVPEDEEEFVAEEEIITKAAAEVTAVQEPVDVPVTALV